MWPGKCFIQTFLKSNCVLLWEGADKLHRTSSANSQDARASTRVRTLLPPPPKKNPHRFPLPFKDTRQWPIALWGYSGSIVRAAFQKKWVIGELRRQTKDLQTRARFGGELPNWWTPYTSVAWWAGNSRQASLVGTSLGKARMLSSGEDLPWGKMPWDKNMMQLGRWRKDTEILSTCCVPGTVRRHFHQFYLRTLKVKHSHSPAESAFFRNKLWQPGSPEPIKQ